MVGNEPPRRPPPPQVSRRGGAETAFNHKTQCNFVCYFDSANSPRNPNKCVSPPRSWSLAFVPSYDFEGDNCRFRSRSPGTTFHVSSRLTWCVLLLLPPFPDVLLSVSALFVRLSSSLSLPLPLEWRRRGGGGKK